MRVFNLLRSGVGFGFEALNVAVVLSLLVEVVLVEVVVHQLVHVV